MAGDDPLIGTRVGPYRLDARIARGGMGVVYHAEHVGLERQAVVKLIAPDFSEDATYRTRFEHEARAAAALDHPNVIPIYDFDESNGQLYIAMRLVEGTDLARLLVSEGRLAPARAARLIAQAAAGLDAAHARGLVHRDVKPANLLIETRGDDEHVFVTDFGLIRAASVSQSGLTRHGGVVGTIDYIAPEQIADDPVDGRADVYGLGCVLYQTLSGEIPFPRGSEFSKMNAHVNDPPPDFTDPELERSFGSLVKWAMAKRPDDRPASAGALGRAALEMARIEPAGSGIHFPTGVSAEQATEPLDTGLEPTEPLTAEPAVAEPPPTEPPVAEPPAAAGHPPEPPAGRPPTSEPPTVRAPGPRRRVIAAFGGAATLAAIVVGVLLLTGGGSDRHASGSTPVVNTTSGPISTTDNSGATSTTGATGSSGSTGNTGNTGNTGSAGVSQSEATAFVNQYRDAWQSGDADQVADLFVTQDRDTARRLAATRFQSFGTISSAQVTTPSIQVNSDGTARVQFVMTLTTSTGQTVSNPVSASLIKEGGFVEITGSVPTTGLGGP